VETIYRCESCGERVLPGDGYIHSAAVAKWAVHHRRCAGDLTHDVCFAVPQHWWDLLDSHWWYSQQKANAE
jgi:hypothetical protein